MVIQTSSNNGGIDVCMYTTSSYELWGNTVVNEDLVLRHYGKWFVQETKNMFPLWPQSANCARRGWSSNRSYNRIIWKPLKCLSWY